MCYRIFKRPVKLPEHPLMSFAVFENWRPACLSVDSNETLTGEFGILKHSIADVRNNWKIVLLVEHRKKIYLRSLEFEDVTFRTRILELLKKTGYLMHVAATLVVDFRYACWTAAVICACGAAPSAIRV